MALEEGVRDEVRFARQMIMPEVGKEGQQRIRRATVLVVGCGALGSAAIPALAGSGVGHFILVDSDIVEGTNLHRQPLHGVSDIGRLKVESARDGIHRIDPKIVVETHACTFDIETGRQLVDKVDVILDGTDRVRSRRDIDTICSERGIPWVHGGIYRFSGQVTVFGWGYGPRYNDLFPPSPEPQRDCSATGVLPHIPALIGSIQAGQVIEIILGRAPSLSGFLLLVDGENTKFQKIKIQNEVPHKPLWRDETFPKEPTRIQPDEVIRRFTNGWSPVILDLSPISNESLPYPFVEGMHTSTNSILSDIDELEPEVDLLLVCPFGIRSDTAAYNLIKEGLGQKRIHVLDGGLIRLAENSDN